MKKHLLAVLFLSSTIASAKIPLFIRSAQELETTAAPLPGKKIVCTATLNSANEKEVFERKLSKSEFQFVELTLVDQWAPQTDPKKSWFDRACDSNIECDIVIISGHFGGVFFGSSGKRLSFNDLENRSCRKDCNGILSHPKEVFLFGCNTLASKDADSRTREEYIRVLIEDGYSHNQAEEVAEARYGATGEQNRDRMRRAFLNVPYIYGFKTKAPLGDAISPYLARYVDKAMPYENHLNNMNLHPEKTADSFPNQLLDLSLKNIPHQGLFQCAGLSGLNKNDPYYQINLNLCQFYTYMKDMNEKMKFALQLLTSNDGRLYFPTIIKFILDTRNYTVQNMPAKTDMKKNLLVKELYLKLLDDMITPVMQSQWLAAGRHMEWLSENEYQQKGLTIYKKVFSEPMGSLSNEVSSMVCSMYFKDIQLIDVNAISTLVKPEHLRSIDGLQAVYCSQALKNARVLNLLRTEIKQAIAKDDVALSTMIAVLDLEDLTLDTITSSILNDISTVCNAKSWVMGSCIAAFTHLEPVNSTAISLAQRMIAEKHKDVNSAVKLLTVAHRRYAGPESDIVRALPTGAGYDFKIYDNYFAQFPPQNEDVKKNLLARLQNCRPGACAGLIQALQSAQTTPEEFIARLRSSANTTDIDYWKSIFLSASHQNQFTVPMAQELFRREIFFGDFTRIVDALSELMNNTGFQTALLQDQTALENMCSSLNMYNMYKTVTVKVECFDKISTWNAAVSNTTIAKAVAFKALEQNRFTSRASAKNYLLKIRNQLSVAELQILQNY